MDRTQLRLTVALAASLLAHAALMQAVEGAAARRAAQGGQPLSLNARLMPPETPIAPLSETLATPEPARVPRALPLEVKDVAVPRRVEPAVFTPVPTPRAMENATATPAPGNAAYTAVSDPTYYSARSLDIYPQAIGVMNLSALLPHGAAGQVRATVLIDEAGTVNEVRAIEAAAADIENAARELLLRTRFTPASKDGRAVKAQLLLSLPYGATSASIVK